MSCWKLSQAATGGRRVEEDNSNGGFRNMSCSTDPFNPLEQQTPNPFWHHWANFPSSSPQAVNSPLFGLIMGWMFYPSAQIQLMKFLTIFSSDRYYFFFFFFFLFTPSQINHLHYCFTACLMFFFLQLWSCLHSSIATESWCQMPVRSSRTSVPCLSASTALFH